MPNYGRMQNDERRAQTPTATHPEWGVHVAVRTERRREPPILPTSPLTQRAGFVFPAPNRAGRHP